MGDMPHTNPPIPGAAIIRQIAVEAPCDPKTVIKYLRGGKCTPLVRQRIDPVLRRLGLDLGVVHQDESARLVGAARGKK